MLTNNNIKLTCRQGGPTVRSIPSISEGQRPTFGREKTAISENEYSFILYGDSATSNATIKNKTRIQ